MRCQTQNIAIVQLPRAREALNLAMVYYMGVIINICDYFGENPVPGNFIAEEVHENRARSKMRLAFTSCLCGFDCLHF